MGIIHTEGVTARAVGVPRADNAYWLGTAAHAAWWRGWDDQAPDHPASNRAT
jgi:hypothetical protein